MYFHRTCVSAGQIRVLSSVLFCCNNSDIKKKIPKTERNQDSISKNGIQNQALSNLSSICLGQYLTSVLQSSLGDGK